jgi:hypothetical protein
VSQIPNKARAYELYLAGEFGNKLRTWANVEEFRRSGFAGEVSIRNAKIPNWKTRYRVPAAEAREVTVDGATFNESAPDDHLTLQGEVARTAELGLYLRYSTEPNLKMKEAMAQPKHATLLRAAAFLSVHLWPSSLDDLYELLDRFPDATVEFSAFSCAVGDCLYRNTIFWEVRDGY